MQNRDMSASHPPSPAAAARQALAALERYQGRVRPLATHSLDAVLYRATSNELDAVRSACAGIPALSTAWVTLLIAHAEFVHGLWQSTKPGDAAAAADREALLERVLGAAQGLERACMALLAD